MDKIYSVSTTASINIAVTKYDFTPPAPDSVPSDPAGSSSPLPLSLITLKSNNVLPNIFLNRYWRKRHTKLNLPTNTSLPSRPKNTHNCGL